MATIRDEAINYKPQQLNNIADLEKVSLDFDLLDGKGVDGEGKEYGYKYIVVNNLKYRIPSSVIEEVQKMLKIKDSIKFVKVNKTGEGLKTKYAVEVTE